MPDALTRATSTGGPTRHRPQHAILGVVMVMRMRMLMMVVVAVVISLQRSMAALAHSRALVDRGAGLDQLGQRRAVVPLKIA
eukprot:24628-Eustigmatos_ZCMA.PRE.1